MFGLGLAGDGIDWYMLLPRGETVVIRGPVLAQLRAGSRDDVAPRLVVWLWRGVGIWAFSSGGCVTVSWKKKT